jgi:hypothetical protein
MGRFMLDEIVSEMYFLKEDNGFVNRGILENNAASTPLEHRRVNRFKTTNYFIFQLVIAQCRGPAKPIWRCRLVVRRVPAAEGPE